MSDRTAEQLKRLADTTNGYIDDLTAQRDAAVARAEAAEQAVQRVRELADHWQHIPDRRPCVALLRRALDGSP